MTDRWQGFRFARMTQFIDDQDQAIPAVLGLAIVEFAGQAADGGWVAVFEQPIREDDGTWWRSVATGVAGSPAEPIPSSYHVYGDVTITVDVDGMPGRPVLQHSRDPEAVTVWHRSMRVHMELRDALAEMRRKHDVRIHLPGADR